MKAPAFWGYWGNAQPQTRRLEALATPGKGTVCYRCSTAPERSFSHWQAALPAPKSPFWLVSYHNLNPPPKDSSAIAALQASGTGGTPDAWVQAEANTLILGRGIFGRVPLYGMPQEQGIWFASHLTLLLPLISGAQIDLAALYGYTCFSYVPTPQTPVEGIFAVVAGTEQHWQLTERDCVLHQTKSLHQWRSSPVKLKNEKDARRYADSCAIARLQTLLQNAVARQLENLPSQPVAVFLSGGLDSSTIAALLVRAGIQTRAYTLDFGTAGIPEWPYAEQVADFLQIPLVKVKATPREIKKAFSATVTALDLPFGDGVTVPLSLLCKAASQETAVIFNGENGDQLFAGWTNKPLIAAGIYNQEEAFMTQYLRTFHRLWGYEMQVFQPEVYQQIHTLDPQSWLNNALDPTFSTELLDRLRRATLMLKGAQNIQPRATNLGLWYGLQVRSPFCDFPLTEWTFELPGEIFLQGSCEKYLLKRAVENWLPPEIVWREKRGMGVPLAEWYLTELRSLLGDYLSPLQLRDRGLFRLDLPTNVILGKLGGQIRSRRTGEILWLLLMWEAWRVQVLGETVRGNFFLNPLRLPAWVWQFWIRNERCNGL